MDRFSFFVGNYTQVPWKDDMVVDVIQRCSSFCEALKEIPSGGKIGALLSQHVIHSTLCSYISLILLKIRG